MDRAELDALKAKAESARLMKEKIAEIGGITEYRVQSDKVGSDWLVTSVNGVEVKKVYVEQDVPMGTAEYPITFVDGVQLIPNAYYVREGVRYVYMGMPKSAESWESVSDVMVEF